MRLAFLVLALLAPQSREKELWEKLEPSFKPLPEFKDDFGKLPSLLKFADGREVKTADDWKQRRAEILATWTKLLGPWPPLVENPVVQEQFKEEVEDFTRHRLEIEIGPGRKTFAYLLRPKGPGPFAAIVDVFYYPEDGAGMKADKRQQNDFGYQAVKRGLIALCVGQNPTSPRPNADLYFPTWDKAQLQPLSWLAYVAANAHTVLSQRKDVDPKRIGVVGHSYGGKWALFAGALYEKFAAVCISDPGIVFDEARGNVNYWEPWYLGTTRDGVPRPRRADGEKRPNGPLQADDRREEGSARAALAHRSAAVLRLGRLRGQARPLGGAQPHGRGEQDPRGREPRGHAQPSRAQDHSGGERARGRLLRVFPQGKEVESAAPHV
jgi:dienelactone hydrolase